MNIPGLVGLATRTNSVYYLEMSRTAEAIRPDNTINSLMWTVDFEEVARAVRANDIPSLNNILLDGARRVAAGGAEFIVLTSNTSHSAVARLEAEIGLPVLDIRSVAARELIGRGSTVIGVLSTSATRTERLYEHVLEPAGMRVVHPSADTATEVDRIIFTELVKGNTDGDAVAILSVAANELRSVGAQAVLLACTDMTLIADQFSDPDILDTTTLHARATGMVAADARPLDEALKAVSAEITGKRR